VDAPRKQGLIWIKAPIHGHTARKRILFWVDNQHGENEAQFALVPRPAISLGHVLTCSRAYAGKIEARKPLPVKEFDLALTMADEIEDARFL
jgi:hypothetical protein